LFVFSNFSGIQAGIYTTNSPEACLHCLKKSYANIIVVQNTLQLDKILKVKDEAPDLKAIIQVEGTPDKPGVFSVNTVLHRKSNTTTL